MNAAVDRPSAVAIARFLARTGAEIREFDGDGGNVERWMLEQAAGYLEAEPPDIRTALARAEEGWAHAFRGNWVEGRLESWLCAAVSELLRGAQ